MTATKQTPATLSAEATAFLALPPEKRRNIIIVEDALFEQAKAAARPSELFDSAGQLAVVGSMFFGIGAIVLPLAAAAYDAFASHRASLQPLILSRTQASELNLKFPTPRPQEKIVYVAHPLVADVYYPLAEFHLRVMLDKRREAERILKGLGATSIEIKYRRGYSRDIASKVKLPAGYLAGSIEAGTKKSSSREETLQLSLKPRKKAKPALPKDLVWYPSELSWHLPVEKALAGEVSGFQLEITSTDDYGVNTQVTAEAAKAKLDLGGNYAAHEVTEWVMSARFDEPGRSRTISRPPAKKAKSRKIRSR